MQPQRPQVRDRNLRPLPDVSNDDDEGSTCIDMDDEVNNMDDIDEDLPPGHNAIPEAAGVAATELCNP